MTFVPRLSTAAENRATWRRQSGAVQRGGFWRVVKGERRGTRAPHIAGVCQGALARQGQSLRSSFCRGLGHTGTALAEAIAVAIHLEDADMMCQPVEQRAGQALGAEGLGPLVEGQIAGNQRGAAFIAL